MSLPAAVSQSGSGRWALDPINRQPGNLLHFIRKSKPGLRAYNLRKAHKGFVSSFSLGKGSGVGHLPPKFGNTQSVAPNPKA